VCDYVKLLDFGLVKAIDTERQKTLTAADAITGTPLYLPPENLSDSEAADARSDLYSLGGVAYFLLTGHAVFEGGSVMDIIRQQVEAIPSPPSQRSGRPMSPDLEALVLRCLAKMPAERPQSAAEVVAALRKCKPVQAWTADDAAAWWRAYEAQASSGTAGTATQKVILNRTLGYSEANKQA
jgi:serine/threonine protein kinase